MKGRKAQLSLRGMLFFPTPYHTAFTFLNQLNNYQIQILGKEKFKEAPAYAPPYSIKFTFD